MKSNLLHFTFSEDAGISRQREPVRFGVPIQCGGLSSANGLALLDNSTQQKQSNTEINAVSFWPDGSCQWLEISTVLDIDANQSKTLSLVALTDGRTVDGKHELDASGRMPARPFIRHRLESDGAIKLDRGSSSVRLDFYVTNASGCRMTLKLESQHKVKSNASVEQILFKGSTLSQSAVGELQFSVQLTHYLHSDLLDLNICLHNPAAAIHKNGLWDLGDPNSFEFLESGVMIDYGNSSDKWLELHSEVGSNTYAFQHSMQLLQLASGGDNASSAAHMDKHGKVHVLSEGYELEVDGDSLLNGKRAVPIVAAVLEDVALRIHLSDFWEAFPTGIHASQGQTEINLHAESEKVVHELQPGERSAKLLTLGFDELSADSDKRWLANRLNSPVIEAGELRIADNILQHALSALTPLDESLLKFVANPDIFFEKRELVDEYGWRNFGDVFADHESLYIAAGDEPLVSHYNNQYDLVLGFGLQYLRTMDVRWLTLMKDLANHVNNIDIYHTENDRVEYNGGLFWHTNHYQDADTATHRTFSEKHYDANQPWGSSGGPSPEHCYTGGLALHYFLVRDATSAESVLKLTRWISTYMDGDSCLMGCLHSIAKSELGNIVNCILRRPVKQFQYPFTRATGNYLNACLDSYAITGDQQWLLKADYIVQNTFHCDDLIESRDLENIEGTWFHTIFLQAVVRYLVVKIDLGETDAAFSHSKQAFLHYMRWMVENTVPYLENPSALEFANDTWAAQDIRRYGLLVAASKMDLAHAELFTAKAELFASHIVKQLEASDTVRFTRIQAVILQNMSLIVRTHTESNNAVPELRKISMLGECVSAVKKFGSGLRNFNWQHEYRWLRSRF